MRILLSGASGFVGRALVRDLAGRGHQIIGITRNAGRAPDLPCQWLEASLQEGFDDEFEKALGEEPIGAVVHLAGEGVASGRWTEKRRSSILDSRIQSATNLCHLAQKKGIPVFVSASAIGFYGHRGDELLTENSSPGAGFLSEVCQKWENAVLESSLPARKVVLRIGMVLGKGGGALEKILPVFRFGLGGPLGSGQQWMAWIHLDDVIRVIGRAMDDSSLSGVYNTVAFKPVRNKEFTRVLAKVLRRPAFIPAPEWGLRIAMGELADLVLASQNVVPSRLEAAGFDFKYGDLESALREIVS